MLGRADVSTAVNRSGSASTHSRPTGSVAASWTIGPSSARAIQVASTGSVMALRVDRSD